jgi:EAL domain-containing protein (putative c-di-GMP-specific phosphodiesterase class I)
LSVTAEGIEHPIQLERLVDLGCDYGQGFLFGHPQPVTVHAPRAGQQRHKSE